VNKPVFQTAADAFAGWRDNVLSGEPPTLYPIGTGPLANIPLGPGLVTLLGGAPGSGKTAFVMQGIIDAMRLTETLRVCVCNVEMGPDVLLDRQLARLSGIDLKTIRFRKFQAEHADRLEQSLNTLEVLADRLCFVRPPFDLANAAAVADSFEADVIVLDYLQRIPPPGDHGDKRGSVDACMNFLRQFADVGMAVVALAAVSRTKDSKGRQSYDGDGLSLASFRESSELEFGADDAFLLVPKPKTTDTVVLRHLKARHSEPRDIELKFDRPRQSFTTPAVGEPSRTNRGSVSNRIEDAVIEAWETAAIAEEDADESQ
jgi:replicative DNA helicase